MKMPASPASQGLRLPLIAPCFCLGASPKLVNSTLLTERFIALAISSVSNRPAAPTTMPAIISAGLPSTKPSSPTAKPVKAL
jgi:hypothetical protein